MSELVCEKKREKDVTYLWHGWGSEVIIRLDESVVVSRALGSLGVSDGLSNMCHIHVYLCMCGYGGEQISGYFIARRVLLMASYNGFW